MENEEKEVNCWIVYLMPFIQKERDEDFVEEYQLYCIENRIFGMGWSNCKNGELKREFFGKNLKDAGVLEEFKKRYKELNKADSYISEKALKSFKDICKNDIVIMRLKNGRYYIGKVKEEATYSDGKDKKFLEELKSESPGMSWCCKVDNKWEEFYERDLPAHIIGRFAQSMHSTITRVSNSTQKKLIQALYKSRTEKNYEIPKIKLKEKDFHEALNPKELEDLVYEYIINQEGNENYKLLPSQCAKSKIKYEYSLINEENYKDVITCQVKNIADVNYKKYIDDGKEFSKIYLFSGIGEYNEKTEEEAIKDIEQIKNREKSKKRIVVEIIKREELYDFLTKKSKFVKKMLIQSGYYEF